MGTTHRRSNQGEYPAFLVRGISNARTLYATAKVSQTYIRQNSDSGRNASSIKPARQAINQHATRRRYGSRRRLDGKRKLFIA
jgi:hypothetical protein